MSFQGFGKNSGPGAPPTAPNPFAGNYPRTSAPALPSPTQPLFAPPSFHPSNRPRAASPKWADEYPTLAEAYTGQISQRPAVTPSISIANTGRGEPAKSFQAQDKKRERSLPSLFPDEGALRNSNTVTGRPRFSSPVWPNQNKLSGQFAGSNKKDLSAVSPNLVGYGIGRISSAKQDNVQVPKINRSPPVNYDDIEGFSEDSISDQTDSRRLSTRLADHPNTHDSHSHASFAPSIRTIGTEAAAIKPPNSSVPKRSRSPSLNPSDKNFQGNSYDTQDDTERELQAKAKRLARFKDELSQPEPSSIAVGNQKVFRGHDQSIMVKQNMMGQPLDLTADYPSANTSTDYEGPDSSSIIAGSCPEMCPDSERAERERKGDLDRYERVGGDRNQTSRSLAVKKYTRTAEREASLIRPMPILQKTMNYLLELLDQPYDDGFLGLYNFLWDRMRAIRMDLRMQHIFNLEAITMLEQMIRLHIIAMHELCEYTKGEGFSEGFDAHLNIEQMNKTSVELFQLYDDHRKNGIDVPTEKEFRGYYALLKLDKHPGYKVEPAELSLDLAKMTPQVRQAADVLFARDVARSCRIGNFIAFFRLVRKSSYLQACLMHAHFAKLRTQALASLHSGLQSNQGIPVEHVAQWLGMEDEDIEDLLDYHGFSIKEFGEPYMVKEGPFLNSNDSGTPKCSKLVHLKKHKTMLEDVLSPSPMEQASSREVKEVSFDEVYEQEPTPVQFNATQSSLVEVEMESEPVSTPTKEVQTNQILKGIVNTQQSGDDDQVAVWSPLPLYIFPTHDPSEYMDHRVNDFRTDSYKFKFRNSLEKNKYSDVKTNVLDVMPRGGDRERLPELEIDVATEKLVRSPEPVDDLNDEQCITREDLETAEAGTTYLDEELSQAKLKLILWKWRRHAYRKRELRKKKQMAADAALSSLSLGPSIRHYEEQQSTTGKFNIHHVVRERYDKNERSWSKLNVSEVVAGKLRERNASSKCLCWKVVVCSQMDRPDGDELEHRSSVSSLAAGSWLCSKIIPAGDCIIDDLITSSTGLSLWKKWIHDLSCDELICCLSIIKDTRSDNRIENIAGASAVMFLVYECIPLELQKIRLRNLVMSLPSGSGLPLLILSDSCRNRSDPSLVADGLGLNVLDKSRISCFFIDFLLENQNTVSRDGFFSDDLLRNGLQWLASNSPLQPVLQNVKTQELVFAHLNPFIKVLDGLGAYDATPLHCILAFNSALDQSIKEVLAAADSNPSHWPCPEIALLDFCDEHKAVDWYLPVAGWSSAAGIEPVTHALNQCKLPAFPDDTSWLFRGSDSDDIENQKSRLEDCLSRYLSQTSQIMGLSLAKQEAHAVLQKCTRLELHESTYYIVPKWVIIFRRVYNWRLMKLLNGEIATTYVLRQNDKITTPADDNIHDEGDISFHSTIIEPSLDEMLEVSSNLLHHPECRSFQRSATRSLNDIEVLNAAEEIEVVDREWESKQDNNLGDIDTGLNTINNTSSELAISDVTKEADRLSELLEKCNMLQNAIDKNLSIYF